MGLTRDLAPFNRFLHSCGVLPFCARSLLSARAGEVPQSPEKEPPDNHAGGHGSQRAFARVKGEDVFALRALGSVAP